MTEEYNRHHAEFDADFGGQTRPFRLNYDLAVQWESASGHSLFMTAKKLVHTYQAHSTDIRELVRLGLIGGGMKPNDAQRLVEIYVERRPLDETWPLATEIAESYLFGSEAWRKANGKAVEYNV